MLTDELRSKLEEEDTHGIEDLFMNECDSWFTADIACCGSCVDDFLKSWPLASIAVDFQTNNMDLEHFYESTRLKDCYSKEDYFKFVQLVNCPRCGLQLIESEYFYPYEFPFEPVEDFEYIISELASLAQIAPFMMLKHYFAEEVFSVIEDLSSQVQPVQIDDYLYRARISSQIIELNDCEFDITPKEFSGEGRYNHSGIPAYYLGSDMETCFQELRGNTSYIAKLKIAKKLKVLDLTASVENYKMHSDILGTLVYSALISAKHDDCGHYKPQYVFSRFIADCARLVGFDAIKYPSTRNHEDSFNIVILSEQYSLKNGTELIDIKLYNGKKMKIC